jgi:hypothetical protein
MQKNIINPDFKFTFDNDSQLRSAEQSGFVDDFDIVRVCIRNLSNGAQLDFPIKTREDYFKFMSQSNEKVEEYEIVEIYQDYHFFDFYNMVLF